MACPFLDSSSESDQHLCLARENDRILISPRYVVACCRTEQYHTCSIYLHADENRIIRIHKENLDRECAPGLAIENVMTSAERAGEPASEANQATQSTDRAGAHGAHTPAGAAHPMSPTITEPAGDGRIEDTVVTLAGMAEPASTVTILDWLKQVATTKSDERGRWSTTLLSLDAGNHMFQAQSRNASGASSPRSPVRTITVGAGSDTATPSGYRGALFERGRAWFRRRPSDVSRTAVSPVAPDIDRVPIEPEQPERGGAASPTSPHDNGPSMTPSPVAAPTGRPKEDTETITEELPVILSPRHNAAEPVIDAEPVVKQKTVPVQAIQLEERPDDPPATKTIPAHVEEIH